MVPTIDNDRDVDNNVAGFPVKERSRLRNATTRLIVEAVFVYAVKDIPG
jgi:hypothetical protein